MYHTDLNALIGAPTGSGKTITAELAALRAFALYPGQKVIYIAPAVACPPPPAGCQWRGDVGVWTKCFGMSLASCGFHRQCPRPAPLKALVKERVEDWTRRFEGILGRGAQVENVVGGARGPG